MPFDGRMTLFAKVTSGLEVKKDTQAQFMKMAGEEIVSRAKERIKGGWLKPLHKIVPADLRWVLWKKYGKKRPYGVRESIYNKMLAERGNPIPLLKTGRLMNSIKVVQIAKNTVVVAATVPYGKIQNEGGISRIPDNKLEAWSNKYGVLFKPNQNILIEGRHFLVYDKRCEERIIKKASKFQFI